jgi:hypothetical protein
MRTSFCLVFFLAACTAQKPAGDPNDPNNPGSPAVTNPTQPPAPSTLLADLRAVGLDPAKLPALDRLSRRQHEAVMDSFASALGVDCDGCHADDKDVDTRNKRVARLMWDQMVKGLRHKGGEPLYCDSCHQGKATFLTRSPTLEDWMKVNFVDGLERADGQTHACATCHGTTFTAQFLPQ